LPGSELRISPLAFGAEPLGGTDWGTVDAKAMAEAVRRAVDIGINLFDTADVYGLGDSEERLSASLGKDRHRVVLMTKGGVRWERGGDGRARTWADGNPEFLQSALEASLRRLRVDAIGIYFVHRHDPAVPPERTMEFLLRNRAAGKIRAIGVSNFPSAAIEAMAVDCVQFGYSLLQRDAEAELLPLCARRNIAAIAYGPLAQGLLTGKYSQASRFDGSDRRHRLPHWQPEAIAARAPLLERLGETAARHGTTSAAVALRWVLDDARIAAAIAGAKSAAQVEQNAAALGWSLSPEERVRLAA
jgi:aryl-alcohol dehydrogenase-like predicted oxidoreductase